MVPGSISLGNSTAARPTTTMASTPGQPQPGVQRLAREFLNENSEAPLQLGLLRRLDQQPRGLRRLDRPQPRTTNPSAACTTTSPATTMCTTITSQATTTSAAVTTVGPTVVVSTSAAAPALPLPVLTTLYTRPRCFCGSK